MTAGTPYDGDDDADDTDADDDSAQTHDEHPSSANADAGMPAPADDADREGTLKAEPQADSKPKSERDDLAAEVARKRPPQPPQEELDELQQPTTELRSATAKESGSDSASKPADPAPTTAQADRDSRAGDGEHDIGVAGLDELQPVATELRSAAAQVTDAQATASTNADTADTDRDRDSDSEPEDEEDEV